MNQKKGGVALSYFTLVTKVVIAFFYTPFLIKSIGDSHFGIFNVVGSLLAYAAIIDFGVNDTTLRYFIQIKNDKTEDVNNLLGSINALYILIGLGILLFVSLLYPLIPNLFSNSFDAREIVLTQKVFIVSMAGFFTTLVFNPLGAILLANEKFIELKFIELISYIITIVASVSALSCGYGLLQVVTISTIISILSTLIKAYLAFIKLKFPVYLRKFNFSKLKTLGSYAAPIFLVILVEQIYWKLDNLIIGAVIGTQAVAIYAVGFFFQKYILSFTTSISRVFIPQLVSLIEADRENIEAITNFLIKISRYQRLVVFPIIISLAFFGDKFVSLWIGEHYLESYYVIISALIPFSVEIVGNVRNTVFQVNEKYWYRSGVILVIALINVGLTWYLITSTQNIVYAALCTGASLMLGYVLIHIQLIRLNLLNVKSFFEKVWLNAMPFLSLAIVLGFIFRQIDTTSWLSLIVTLGLFLICIAKLAYFTLLNKKEQIQIKSIFSRISILEKL